VKQKLHSEQEYRGMIIPFPFESILLYLYNILDIDPGEFYWRPQEIWPALYQLSFEEKIAHYFAAWSYDNWREYLPNKVHNNLISLSPE